MIKRERETERERERERDIEILHCRGRKGCTRKRVGEKMRISKR